MPHPDKQLSWYKHSFFQWSCIIPISPKPDLTWHFIFSSKRYEIIKNLVPCYSTNKIVYKHVSYWLFSIFFLFSKCQKSNFEDLIILLWWWILIFNKSINRCTNFDIYVNVIKYNANNALWLHVPGLKQNERRFVLLWLSRCFCIVLQPGESKVIFSQRPLLPWTLLYRVVG